MPYRFTTNCVTGCRVWRFYRTVGRPTRSPWYPCAKAAIIAAPMLAVPAQQFGWGTPSWLPSVGGPQYPASLSAASQGIWAAAWVNPVPQQIDMGKAGTTEQPQPQQIPEPASLALLGLGALGAVLARRVG